MFPTSWLVIWLSDSAGSTPFDFAQSSASSRTVALFEQLAHHQAAVKVKVWQTLKSGRCRGMAVTLRCSFLG